MVERHSLGGHGARVAEGHGFAGGFDQDHIGLVAFQSGNFFQLGNFSLGAGIVAPQTTHRTGGFVLGRSLLMTADAGLMGGFP